MTTRGGIRRIKGTLYSSIVTALDCYIGIIWTLRFGMSCKMTHNIHASFWTWHEEEESWFDKIIKNFTRYEAI